jgi:hypothetical protein
MEKSGNLRKDRKQDIIDSISILRSIFINLRNSVEEQTTKINQLVGELNKAKMELMERRVANLPGHTHSHLGAGWGELQHLHPTTSCHLAVDRRNCTLRRSLQAHKRDINS